MAKPDMCSGGILLEVSNVRFDKDKVEVQIKNDRTDSGRAWWPINDGSLACKTYQLIARSLDDKRLVLVELKCDGSCLVGTLIRVQYHDSDKR